MMRQIINPSHTDGRSLLSMDLCQEYYRSGLDGFCQFSYEELSYRLSYFVISLSFLYYFPYVITVLLVQNKYSQSITQSINQSINNLWILVLTPACFSTAVTLTYFSLSSFWLTLLTYGLLFGIGIGFAYGPPVACAMRVSIQIAIVINHQ